MQNLDEIRQNLKQQLIERALCIDNKYLDKYVDLIMTNYSVDTPTDYRQLHHAIPVSYYKRLYVVDVAKAKQFATLDRQNFVVAFSSYDHVLAHCCLLLCAKENWFSDGNKGAISLLESKLTEEELWNLAHEEIYCQTGVWSSFSKENNYYATKPKTSLTANKLYIHLDDQSKLIKPADLADYISNGWKLGRTTTSARCYVHKDGVYKNIQTEYLQEYLTAGWIYGAAGRPRVITGNGRRNRNKLTIHKGADILVIDRSQFMQYFGAGWLPGKKDAKLIFVHQGEHNKRVQVKNFAAALNAGWEPGFKTPKPRKNKNEIKEISEYGK